MDDIAQQLGISKKTLYQFFENKADLIRKVVDFTVSQHKCHVQEIAFEDKNAIEELLMIYQQTSIITKQLNPSLSFELKKYYSESWAILEKFRNEFIHNSILQNLAKGIENKLYREDFNVPIIAKLYTMRSLEVTNAEIFPPHIYPPATVLQEMFIYHIRGIASKKGIDFLENKLQIEL